MSVPAEEAMARARRLLGCPFRPQGRDPRTGLDCAGVVLSSFALPSGRFRRDYRLRGAHLGEVRDALSRHFDAVGASAPSAGDVLLCAVAGDQAHLAIWCGRSFVHADARLRRVVETPGLPTWPIATIFRPARSPSLKS